MSRTHWVIYVKSFPCHEASKCRQLYQSSKCHELGMSSKPNESSVWPAIQLDPIDYIEFVNVTNSMSHQDVTNSISHLNSTSHLCDQSFNSIRLKSSTTSRTQRVMNRHELIESSMYRVFTCQEASGCHELIESSKCHELNGSSISQWWSFVTLLRIT